MKNLYILAVVAFSILSNKGVAQSGHKSTELRPWNAQWIAAPGISGDEYGIYCFRKSINLPHKPAAFKVHVSADNRYKLYINGTLVSLGPARGDSYYWNYETVDIASYLSPGKNVISALVWNEAQYRPEAQISLRTGFILQGNTTLEDIVNTDSTWKSIQDPGHLPIPGYFFAASKGELVDMNHAVKANWQSRLYDDSSWPQAAKIMDGKLKGMAWGIEWALVPSTLPPREMTLQRISKLRSASGISVSPDFPSRKVPVTIPANTTATLLLDQTFETNAYITLNFSGGKDAGISIGYAESLYQKGTKGVVKGNRNEVADKEFIGRTDSLIANGSKGQSFTTLNFRTYRYIKLHVKTSDEALTIDDLYGTFTGYPFTRTAVLESEETELKEILDIGWRTARLNAWETYMDCPYYEQLQYVGDSRIQAMVSYYNTTDDRLARNAISQIDHSRLPEGITRSSYPAKGTQIIPPFSLWYIGMLHDYWMYRNDGEFIKSKLFGERSVLDFFSKYQQPDGSLKDLPYWTFVDWSGNLWGEVKGKDGSAAIHDLQLLLAYQWAAAMEAELGMKEFATLYKHRATQLTATIRQKYWDNSRMLYADTRERNGFSQHVNALAILSGIVSVQEMPAVVRNLTSDKSLTQCSVYFRYYLDQALVKGGVGNDYLNRLDIYRENMALGLSTWAEYSDVNTSRSDCHAWGSSPNIEFFRTVLGIDSDAPGFSKIKIEPHLGNLKRIGGEIPHPAGKVSVKYVLDKNKWNIKINLPQNTSGVLLWKTKVYTLKNGNNLLVIDQ